MKNKEKNETLIETQATPILLTQELCTKLNSKILEQNHKPGLYIVATPIGNMFDISLRALWILKNAKYVFAEDTRQSQKLLNYYEIKAKLIACHEYNEIDSDVTSLVDSQEIFALISDAGTPAVSDPGYRIVNWCLQNKIDVFPIPGPSAAIAAISASGMSSDRFTFFGFLPPKKNARINFLKNIVSEKGTMIFYESPNRLCNTLQDMIEIFEDRLCCICREITKIFEQFKRGNLSECLNYFSENKPTGEFVILLSGAVDGKKEHLEQSNIMENIKAEMQNLLDTISLKESAKIVAEKYGISKNIAYRIGLEIISKS